MQLIELGKHVHGDILSGDGQTPHCIAWMDKHNRMNARLKSLG